MGPDGAAGAVRPDLGPDLCREPVPGRLSEPDADRGPARPGRPSRVLLDAPGGRDGGPREEGLLVERATRIELACLAWEASALPLCYARVDRAQRSGSPSDRHRLTASVVPVLLSDRDLKAALASGRLGLAPYDEAMVQPSSIDVRLDRWFRVFANHRYTHIDPATAQDDLTELVEAVGDEPFVLHPGEFVLGSTLEVISLGDDLAARLEGKALGLDTEVPTPWGWTTMEHLEVGDEVFDETGAPTRVVAATDVMTDRPCFEVLLSDGSRFVADAQHLWVTTTKAERVRVRGGHASVARSVTTEQLAATLRAGREWNHHVAMAGPAQYADRDDLPVDPYVLGVWLGDGTTSCATVTTADAQVVDEVRAAGYDVHRTSAPYGWRVGGRPEDRARDAAGRYAPDAGLNSVLRAEGLLGDKHVPQQYLTAGYDQRLALLQGLMDSDGYADTLGRCEFVSTLEHLSDAVVELAASLGLRPVKRKKRVTLYGVECSPAYQVKFVPHLPVFRLQRKLDRLAPKLRQSRHRAVVAVRPLSSVPVRCIQVAAPSGMFLVGRTYVPTHNSSLGRLGLLTHSTAGFIDPGFSGHVTLELSNVANLPIKLYPGMKIGQVCVLPLSSPAESPYGSERYGSRYQGQRGPTASKSHLRFNVAPTTP
ncbi:MAG: Deoxycytidine triphosphate deaminase [Frankiales bacterium]|nr:Deoxycytidine triphosphate deaminase [Frankiales bacterium]